MALSDFCVLTPLDEEWRIVQDIICPPNRREVTRDPTVYYLWTKEYSHRTERKTYLLVAAALGRMGQTSAASITSCAIYHWAPKHIVLLGIAGGLDPETQHLGHVIVSTEIFGYAIHEVTGPPERWEFRPTGHRLGAGLLNQVRALRDNATEFAAWQEACMRAATPEPKLPKDLRPPEIHFEVTASGNTVAKSPTFTKRLKNSIHSKIKAVEMEADGVFDAVLGSAMRSDVLMIRGISDFADSDKGKLEKETKGAWRKWAAGNAARLFAVLLERAPVANSVSPPLILDLTMETNPAVLLEDGVLLSGDGYYNLAFPQLIDRTEPTPELCLSVLGFTTSGAELIPKQSLCTVFHTDRRRTLYPPRGSRCEFVLPRTEEQILVRVSLAFPTGDEELRRIEVLATDEYGRTRSAVKTMEE